MTRLPPVRVVRAATGVRTAIQGLARRMVPPEVGVLELGSAFMATQAVYAVARLGIADALAAGARTAEEVAADLGTDPDATFRLLRASAAYGIVRHVGDRFDLTRRRSHAPLRLAGLDAVGGADDRRPALPVGVGPARPRRSRRAIRGPRRCTASRCGTCSTATPTTRRPSTTRWAG